MKKFTKFLALILGILVFASCSGERTKGDDKEKGNEKDSDSSYEDVLDKYFAAIADEDSDKFFAVIADEYLTEHYLDKYGYDEDEMEDLAEEVCEDYIEEWVDRIEDNEDIGDLEKIKYKVADTTEFEKDEVKNIASALNEEYGCKEKDVKEVIIAELELTYIGEDDEAEDEIELVLVNVGGDWFVSQLLTPKNVKNLAKSKDQKEEQRETAAPQMTSAPETVAVPETTVAEAAAKETYYPNNTYQNVIYNYYESIENLNLDEYVNAAYDTYNKQSELSWYDDDMDEFLEYCYDDLDYMNWDYSIDFGDLNYIEVTDMYVTYYEDDDFDSIVDYLVYGRNYSSSAIDDIICAEVRLFISGDEDSGYVDEEIILICVDGMWYVAEFLWDREFVEESILQYYTTSYVPEEDYDDYYDYTTDYDYGYDDYPAVTEPVEIAMPEETVVSANASDALWNMYCAKTFNDFERFYGSIVDPYLEAHSSKSYLKDFFKNNLEIVYSELTRAYGNDIYAEWTYDTVEYTSDELNNLRDYLSNYGYSYYAVEDVVSFYSDVTFKGSSSEGTKSEEYIAICVDGNWYISPLFDTIANLHNAIGR